MAGHGRFTVRKISFPSQIATSRRNLATPHVLATEPVNTMPDSELSHFRQNPFVGRLSFEEQTVRSGAMLFNSGDAVRHFRFLMRGTLKMERWTPEGRGVVTALVDAGRFVAEASLYNDVYHCDATAISDCTLLVYDRDSVLSLMRTDPELASSFSSSLAGEIRSLREQVHLMGILDARERVERFLRARSTDGVYEAPVSLSVMAAQIGLAPETLYRKLAEMERTGVVRRTGSIIELSA